MTTPLGIMTQAGPTVLWNDSADPRELAESIAYGAVGATCNPVIAVTCIKADLPTWRRRIAELAEKQPSLSESELGWRVVEDLSVAAAKLLEEAFAAHHGVNGRLSIQTDPRLARSADKLIEQAVHFASLAPNIIVKIPATQPGVAAIEEVTSRGVSVNVTLSFSVAQALAAGEAIERGLRRREAAGLTTDGMGPVVTIMVGRVDDWIKESYVRDGRAFDRGYLEWAGVAVFKHAYAEFQRRGLRARLLSAAFRNLLHWSELVGGNVVISPPFAWQQKIQASGQDAAPRMQVPVADEIVEALLTLPEFRKAYDIDGMTEPEFVAFGAARKTLRQFLQADEELDQLVRDVIVPAP